ncbi:MAG: hypothetical protein KM312_10640 [Hydrogenibacillus schlegelii]|uniref:Uncharacterized protein n=1 Tax=Hydrogenibacillus schlegelii TaxID=1484 RepID=A0A947CZ25_HYDSH|nr:hypothetical protein [Hydrogenibacillus schlegelii]
MVGSVFGGYLLTVWLPYFGIMDLAFGLQESWLYSVSAFFNHMLVVFWTWLMTIGLIGVGAYWNTEANDRFYLEAWRYPAFPSWMGRKILFILFYDAAMYGLAPLPFLFAAYPGESMTVLLLSVFLFLYAAHLSLLYLAASVLGAKSVYALIGTISYHVINLVFDGVGWPNALQYFLIGERAGFVSFFVIAGMMALSTGLMIKKTNPLMIDRDDYKGWE